MTTNEKEIIIREILDSDRKAFELCPPKALTNYFIINEKEGDKEFALRKLTDKNLTKVHRDSLNVLNKIKTKKMN